MLAREGEKDKEKDKDFEKVKVQFFFQNSRFKATPPERMNAHTPEDQKYVLLWMDALYLTSSGLLKINTLLHLPVAFTCEFKCMNTSLMLKLMCTGLPSKPQDSSLYWLISHVYRVINLIPLQAIIFNILS